ncbi:MAG: helix-turn-helix domain-containing protein [Solirubrobacteraceae bacterium]
MTGTAGRRVAVLKVASGQLSVTAAAVEHGFSRRHLHRLLAAYRAGGLDALKPRSRAPRTEPVQHTGDRPDPDGRTAPAFRVPSTSMIRWILRHACRDSGETYV